MASNYYKTALQQPYSIYRRRSPGFGTILHFDCSLSKELKTFSFYVPTVLSK